MTEQAIIALGSNLGEPIRQVNAAIEHWSQQPHVTLLQASSLYRTPPWGELNQPDFINAVLLIETELSAIDLLNTCKQIEQIEQRQLTYRWGPRTLDCDIIDYANQAISTERLTLPHKHWQDRAFVILPLLEIAPDRRIGQQSVKMAYNALNQSEIAQINKL